MTNSISFGSTTQVSLTHQDFYDPDGYFFKNGTDEFGGYYNEELEYVPAEEKKEELEKIKEKLAIEECLE